MEIKLGVSFTPTIKQEKGINDTVKWFNNRFKPIWSIGGIAGSGKSTMINFLLERINLKLENIAILAYTGSASVVLIRKGLPAMTIHRFIYIPVEVEDENHKKKIVFKLKDKIDENIKLILVDEASMVSKTILEDLCSFNIPIILQGDPFQLKPPFGNMNDYMQHPDVFLDEPIRQALDNPIIWFANELRNYRMPSYGKHGDTVRMYSKNSFPINSLTKADQILAGTNKTCENINKLYRTSFLGIKSRLPLNGEKLICLQNDWNLKCLDNECETYMVNGLMGICNNLEFNTINKTYTMDFQPIFMENDKFTKVYGDTLYFYDKLIKGDEDYLQKTYSDVYTSRIPLEARNIKPNYFQYGYCITVYKAQGTESDRILYFDEMYRKDIYWNHFYTAVTRAKKFIDIVK